MSFSGNNRTGEKNITIINLPAKNAFSNKSVHLYHPRSSILLIIHSLGYPKNRSRKFLLATHDYTLATVPSIKKGEPVVKIRSIISLFVCFCKSWASSHHHAKVNSSALKKEFSLSQIKFGNYNQTLFQRVKIC